MIIVPQAHSPARSGNAPLPLMLAPLLAPEAPAAICHQVFDGGILAVHDAGRISRPDAVAALESLHGPVRDVLAEDAELARRPRVVLEEQELDVGAPFLFRDDSSRRRYRVAWDPAQISRDELTMFLTIYVGLPGEYAEVSPETDRALRKLDALREQRPDDPNWTGLLDMWAAATIRSGDPAAVAQQVLALIEQGKQDSAALGVTR
jgi:hypothetical protein